MKFTPRIASALYREPQAEAGGQPDAEPQAGGHGADPPVEPDAEQSQLVRAGPSFRASGDPAGPPPLSSGGAARDSQ